MRRETLVCGACGGPAPREDRVCPWCGAGVAPPAPPAPAASARGGAHAGAAAAPVRKTYCPHCMRLYGEGDAECPRCLPKALPKPAKAPARRGKAAKADDAFWHPEADASERGAHCPACRGALAPQRLGDVTVDRCDACGGTWLDLGEVARVVDCSTWGAAAEKVEAIEAEVRARVPRSDPRRGRACVRCRARTFRRLVAPRGPAWVDVCGRHGMWFDAGELDAFKAFVASGGLEVARRRADHPPRLRRRRRLPFGDTNGGGGGAVDAAGSLLEVLGELFTNH